MSLIKSVVLVWCLAHLGYCITTKKAKDNPDKHNRSVRDPISLIWNLTSYAVQSRQFQNNYITNENNYFLNGNSPAASLGSGQNLLDAMFSIAQNDDHLCVPKLLCEITAGTMSYGRQAFFQEFNIDSLLGVLSSFETLSPLVLFGKAALLGYNSKGNSYSCSQAYPRCPNNPDLLLNYLNNHNGGFFRFFNGVPNREGLSNSGVVGFDGQHYGFVSQNFPIMNKRRYAQRRILNGNKFTFKQNSRDGRKLVFPTHGGDDNVLDIQKPLPNHVPSRTIFPIRTGTGSLILDDYGDNDFYDKSKDFVRFI